MATQARAGIPWRSLLLFSRQTDIPSNQFHSDSLSSTPIPYSHLSSLPLLSSPPLYLSIHPCRIVGFNPPEAIKVSTPTTWTPLPPKRNGLILLIHGNAGGGSEGFEREPESEIPDFCRRATGERRKEGRKGGRKEGRVHLLSPIYKRASLAGRTGPEWAIVREEGDDDDDDDWC